MDKINAFGKTISSSFTPWAARSQQYVREQLGQVDDKTQLPADYLELEKRVDALKQVHQQLLSVVNQYGNEAYDYPPNIRESFTDLGKSIQERVSMLSTVSSAQDVGAAITAPSQLQPQPKTFSHAIARASLNSSDLIAQSHTGAGEDPLAAALEKYALAAEKVGQARLTQDQTIKTRSIAGWNITLSNDIGLATKARGRVETARLNLDATKARSKPGAGWGLPGGVGGGSSAGRADGSEAGEQGLSEKARQEIEHAEDEFVAQTEEAVGVMKNVLDTPEPLRNLAELIAAQLEYHKKAYEILSELAPQVDELQVEQECLYPCFSFLFASYRKSRNAT